MRFSNRRLLAALAIGFCTGCGVARSTKPSNPTEIRLSVPNGAAMVYLPVYAAGPAGCFAREDIQVRLDEAGVATSMQALVGGGVEVAASDYLTLLDVRRQGQPIRAFVLLQKLPGFAAVVSPKASAGIRSIQDLKGRTIGVNARGSGYHRLLNKVLEAHGVNPDEVSVVSVGRGTSLGVSMEHGVVDVGLLGPLGLSYLQQRHLPLKILFDTRTAESTRAALGTDEIAFYILCAREDWLKAHPQAARRLASAMQCALTWVHDHMPQQIREILPDVGRSPDAQSDFDAIEVAKIGLTLDGRMTANAHASAVRFSRAAVAGFSVDAAVSGLCRHCLAAGIQVRSRHHGSEGPEYRCRFTWQRVSSDSELHVTAARHAPGRYPRDRPGYGTMTIPALQDGKVDVMLAQGNTITVLQRQNPNLRMLFDTRTPELTKAALGVEEMPESVLLAHENWLANPGVARRLAGAFQCTLGWIHEHTPEQIREVLPDSCRSPDAAADLDAISSSKYMLSSDGRMTTQMHEAAVRVSGVASQKNLEHAYTNEFLKP
jgi:NitT/TauT family transport system substrate-binding protein